MCSHSEELRIGFNLSFAWINDYCTDFGWKKFPAFKQCTRRKSLPQPDIQQDSYSGNSSLIFVHGLLCPVFVTRIPIYTLRKLTSHLSLETFGAFNLHLMFRLTLVKPTTYFWSKQLTYRGNFFQFFSHKVRFGKFNEYLLSICTRKQLMSMPFTAKLLHILPSRNRLNECFIAHYERAHNF